MNVHVQQSQVNYIIINCDYTLPPHSNTESIRDVQFSPHQANTFAAVSENGNVQLWDVRRHERCLLQFTAHSGPVFACDWHPEMHWLATASRDKTIKVCFLTHVLSTYTLGVVYKLDDDAITFSVGFIIQHIRATMNKAEND